MQQCPICKRWVEKPLQKERCPHELDTEARVSMVSAKGFRQRVKSAKEMVGQQVWFNPKRDRLYTVQGCDNWGMLTLDGVLGQVAPHWCVRAI